MHVLYILTRVTFIFALLCGIASIIAIFKPFPVFLRSRRQAAFVLIAFVSFELSLIIIAGELLSPPELAFGPLSKLPSMMGTLMLTMSVAALFSLLEPPPTPGRERTRAEQKYAFFIAVSILAFVGFVMTAVLQAKASVHDASSDGRANPIGLFAAAQGANAAMDTEDSEARDR